MDADAPTFPIMVVALSLATFPVVLLILGFVFFRMLRPNVTVDEARSRAATALGATAQGPGPATEGQWNARVTDSQIKLNPFSSFGTLRVQDGSLTFIPDGAVQPLWSYPVNTLQAGRNPHPMPSLVWLHHHELGTVQVEVSVEHLNRISRNDLKKGRERIYADAFLAQLRDAGGWIR